MTHDNAEIDRMVYVIGSAVYTDSMVNVEMLALRDALVEDATRSKRYLTDDECEDFVCGDNSEIELIAKEYPSTQKVLESYF